MKIKKTIFNVYALSIISYASEILFFTLLFNSLPINEVGIFSLATAISAFWNLFVDMGLNQTLIREFSNNRNCYKQILAKSLKLRLPVFVMGFIIFCIWVIKSNSNTNYYLSILFACLIQILALLDGTVISFLKATDQQVKANFILMFNSLAKLLIGLILLAKLKINISSGLFAGVLFAKILTIILAYLILLAIFKKYILLDSHSSFEGSLLSAGLKFSGINILTTIQNRLDWIIISIFFTTSEIANYSFANKVYEFLQGFSGIVLATIYPYLCRENRLISKKIETLFKLSLFFFSGVSVLIALFSQDIFHLLWQTKYDASFCALQLLMVGFPLSFLSGILFYSMIAKFYEGNILTILIFSTICQGLVNIIVIPKYGIIGAAAGMVILWLLTAFGNLFAYTKLYDMSAKEILKKYNYFFPILFTSIILVSCASHANIFVRVTFFLSIYFLLFLMIFSKSEKGYIFASLSGRR